MTLPSFKIEAIFDVFSLSKSLRGISNRHSPDSISFVAIMPYSAQEPSFPILTYKKKNIYTTQWCSQHVAYACTYTAGPALKIRLGPHSKKYCFLGVTVVFMSMYFLSFLFSFRCELLLQIFLSQDE